MLDGVGKVDDNFFLSYDFKWMLTARLKQISHLPLSKYSCEGAGGGGALFMQMPWTILNMC